MKRACVGLAVVLFVLFESVQAQDNLQPTWIAEWLKAVAAHQPGILDEPAGKYGRLPMMQVQQTVRDYIGLLKLDRTTRASPDPPPVVVYKKKSFKLPDLEALLGLSTDEAARGDANRILKRAALLHTDIARFVPAAPAETRIGSISFRTSSSVPVLNDGRNTGTEEISPHWDLARWLLDEVSPSPATDSTVRDWYYAMVAHDVARRRWGTAGPNLSKARQVRPIDARILFYTGVLHEAMAAPDIQNAMNSMIAQRVSFVSVLSEERELSNAERFLRQAVTIAPAFSEARLRLGHVLGRMGRNDEAADELRRATGELTDPPLMYYAALFLGRADAELGRRDEAHKAFERASGLFPLAQSPLLAESQLARREDDPPRALAALQRLLTLSSRVRDRDDPWWTYDTAAARDAADLMIALYRPFLAGPPR